MSRDPDATQCAAAPPVPDGHGSGEAAYAVLRGVRPLYSASARAVDDALRGTGLTVPVRAVLELLLAEGPLTVPQVARDFGVTRQSVQALVDTGVSRGLLELHDNPHHLRSRLVVVTDEGRSAFADVHRREIANLERVTADLDPDDLVRCAGVLTTLTERLERLHDHEQEAAVNPSIDLIVPTQHLEPVDRGGYDLYLPDAAGRPPVVVVVHGLFEQPPAVSPRRTPFFRAYASQLAQRGVAAVVLDHELTGGMHYPAASATLDRVLSDVRGSGDVDGERVALWCFSGGGPLAYPVLAASPGWLRCVGLTYPLLPTEDIPGWPSLSDAIAGLGDTPVVLTRVEHEIPMFVAGQQALAEARPAGLSTIEVPGAQHGFDAGPDTGHGRVAVVRALDEVAGHLVRTPVLRS